MKTATAKASQPLQRYQKISTSFRVQPQRSHPRLPKKVTRIIGQIDQGCSMAEICDKEQISTAQCQAIVKKLTLDGILEPLVPPDKLPQAMPVLSEQRWLETLKGLPVLGSKDFNALEEAFFNAELEEQREEDLPPARLTDRLRGLLTALRGRRN